MAWRDDRAFRLDAATLDQGPGVTSETRAQRCRGSRREIATLLAASALGEWMMRGLSSDFLEERACVRGHHLTSRFECCLSAV